MCEPVEECRCHFCVHCLTAHVYMHERGDAGALIEFAKKVEQQCAARRAERQVAKRLTILLLGVNSLKCPCDFDCEFGLEHENGGRFSAACRLGFNALRAFTNSEDRRVCRNAVGHAESNKDNAGHGPRTDRVAVVDRSAHNPHDHRYFGRAFVDRWLSGKPEKRPLMCRHFFNPVVLPALAQPADSSCALGH